MAERTSRLAGLWIGDAISNTSHSNKAGSTTVKRARLKVKDQGRRQCCHNRHKKFLYRPIRDASLLSGHASYIHTYMYVYTYTFIRTYIHTHTHIHKYTYTHTFIHTYVHTHTCMHTYIHTHIHTYIHSCIHTYIHA
jgi:hypothetical protein